MLNERYFSAEHQSSFSNNGQHLSGDRGRTFIDFLISALCSKKSFSSSALSISSFLAITCIKLINPGAKNHLGDEMVGQYELSGLQMPPYIEIPYLLDRERGDKGNKGENEAPFEELIHIELLYHIFVK